MFWWLEIYPYNKSQNQLVEVIFFGLSSKYVRYKQCIVVPIDWYFDQRYVNVLWHIPVGNIILVIVMAYGITLL